MEILHNNLLSLEKTLQIVKNNSLLLEKINKSGSRMHETILNGGKILIAGNGGSAAEAQHFSAELIARFKKERVSYPSISLTTDTSILTAIGNDYGFDRIFERQIEGLGDAKDVFIAMSTSGNSENIIKAVTKAKEKNIYTIGLLGKDGGALAGLVDEAIIIPSDETAHIQELHLLILHTWCEIIEA